jgi:hypothetical protein
LAKCCCLDGSHRTCQKIGNIALYLVCHQLEYAFPKYSTCLLCFLLVQLCSKREKKTYKKVIRGAAGTCVTHGVVGACTF